MNQECIVNKVMHYIKLHDENCENDNHVIINQCKHINSYQEIFNHADFDKNTLNVIGKKNIKSVKICAFSTFLFLNLPGIIKHDIISD